MNSMGVSVRSTVIHNPRRKDVGAVVAPDVQKCRHAAIIMIVLVFGVELSENREQVFLDARKDAFDMRAGRGARDRVDSYELE